MPLPIEVEMRLIKQLEDAITAFWAPYCFVHGRKHEWIRRWGWKTDWIYLVHKKRSRIIVNFCVLVPSPKAFDYVDIVSLEWLSHSPGRTFDLPRFSWTARRFVPNILNRMPVAVRWYDGFNTSEKCLDRQVNNPDVSQSSPGFKYRQKYLLSLLEDAAKGCCLLNLKHNYPDEYSRSLFDVSWKGPLGKLADEEAEPELTVGAQVLDQYDAEVTIIGIDHAALDGHGTVTIRYEDGYVDKLPLDESGLRTFKLCDE